MKFLEAIGPVGVILLIFFVVYVIPTWLGL